MRTIPDPGFADDDGTADPVVKSALDSFRVDPEGNYSSTLAVLQASRVLVPVVALLGEVQYDESGLAHDKTSDMAAVLLVGEDGRRGLLAFTSHGAMQAWNRDARPVPVALRTAAQAAVAEGAAALVIDVAGPTVFALEDEDLSATAEGARIVQIGAKWAWIKPAG